LAAGGRPYAAAHEIASLGPTDRRLTYPQAERNGNETYTYPALVSASADTASPVTGSPLGHGNPRSHV
jgi:hypothetical protein